MLFHRRFPALALALLALGAAACMDDSAGPGQPALSNAQADSLAEMLVMDADAEIDGATSTSAASGFAVTAPGAASLNASICLPTLSPTPVVNTDGDRAPDSLRIAFGHCANTWPFHVDSISGTIDLIDPAPAGAGAGLKTVFTGLTHKRVFTISGLWTSIALNGVRLATRDASVLQHSVTDFSTDYVFRNGGTASHDRTWTSTFTADVAGSILADSPLPSGTWNVSGTSSWTRGARSHQVTVTTNPALHFNSACTVVPRFDAGTLTAVVVRNGATSTVTVQFTACGTYTVTRT
jgi:hypothetical protein